MPRTLSFPLIACFLALHGPAAPLLEQPLAELLAAPFPHCQEGLRTVSVRFHLRPDGTVDLVEADARDPAFREAVERRFREGLEVPVLGGTWQAVSLALRPVPPAGD